MKMDNIIRKGELFVLCRNGILPKQWHNRYFILYGEAEKKQPRLDEFDKESTYIKDPTNRKTIFIEEILDIEVCEKSLKGRSHAFKLILRNKKKILAADTEENKDAWVQHLRDVKDGNKTIPTIPENDELRDDLTEENCIYEATTIYNEYKVDVVGTKAAMDCDLPSTCIMDITNTSIDIFSLDHVRLHQWHYKCIRRYGRNKTSFTFECGRKSPTGQGTFVFATLDGEQIFKSVQANLRSLKGSNDSLKDLGEIEGPTLPKRNYDQVTYSELASVANNNPNNTEKASSSLKSPPLLKIRSSDAPTPPPRNEMGFDFDDEKHLYCEPGDRLSMSTNKEDSNGVIYSEPFANKEVSDEKNEKAIYQEVRKKIDENFYCQYDLTLSSKFDVLRAESPTENDKCSKFAQVYDNSKNAASDGYDCIANLKYENSEIDSKEAYDGLYDFIK